MNAASRSISQQRLLPGYVSLFTLSKRSLGLAVLIIAVLLSALSVIYMKDYSRRSFTELQMMQTDAQQANTVYNQLLLEESTWATQARIQQVATQDLHMETPSANAITMVRQ